MRIFLILFTIVFSSHVMGAEDDDRMPQSDGHPFQKLYKGMPILVQEENAQQTQTLHFMNAENQLVLSATLPFSYIVNVVQVNPKTIYIHGSIKSILSLSWWTGPILSEPATYSFVFVDAIHADAHGHLYVVGSDLSEDLEDHSDLCSVIRITGDRISPRTTYGFDTVHSMACAPDGSLYVIGHCKDQKYAVSHVINDIPSPLTTYGLRRVYDITVSADGSFYAKGENDQKQDAIVYVSKDGEVFPPNTFNLKHIWLSSVLDNGYLYILGESLEGQKSIYHIYRNDISPPETYGFSSTSFMNVSPQGDMYIEGHPIGETQEIKRLYIHNNGQRDILNNVSSVLFLG